MDTEYPIVFTSFIYHLSPQEMCAEKIRALLTRQKGRDFFDLWFLTSKGISINNEVVKEKLKYYKITGNHLASLLKRVKEFPEKDFIMDVRPFVPIGERNKLKERFDYIKTYLINKLTTGYNES